VHNHKNHGGLMMDILINVVNLCFVILILVTIPVIGHSQNLVPNSSFEEYKKLRCNQVDYLPDVKAAFDSLLENWEMPTKGTADIYNHLVNEDCVTHPNPKVGYGSPDPKDRNAMTGVIVGVFNRDENQPHYREYLQVKLKEKLVPGKKYTAGYYSSLANSVGYASNNLSMFFSKEKIESDTNGILPYRPQVNNTKIEKDRLKWVLFHQCFEADSEAAYLTIGNFYTDEETKFLKTQEAISNISYYFIDSVFVEPVNELIIPNVITSNKDSLNDEFVIEGLDQKWWSLKLFNRWGKEVYHSQQYNNEWGGEGLSSGVYFYVLQHVCDNIRYKGPLTIIH
jgi:gliding motility-associated-like protein